MPMQAQYALELFYNHSVFGNLINPSNVSDVTISSPLLVCRHVFVFVLVERITDTVVVVMTRLINNEMIKKIL